MVKNIFSIAGKYMEIDESLSTHDKILLTAQQVFIEKGKDGARMQEIANQAGVNKAMLFYYFNNKELLYLEVLRSIVRRLFQKVNEVVISEQEPRNKLEQFVEAYINFLTENEGLPRIILREIASGGETIGKIFNETLSQGENPISVKIHSLIEQSIQKGQFRKVDPIQTIISIVGMCVIYFIANPLLRHIFSFKDIDQKKFVEDRKKHIVDLLEHGLIRS